TVDRRHHAPEIHERDANVRYIFPPIKQQSLSVLLLLKLVVTMPLAAPINIDYLAFLSSVPLTCSLPPEADDGSIVRQGFPFRIKNNLPAVVAHQRFTSSLEKFYRSGTFHLPNADRGWEIPSCQVDPRRGAQ